MPKKHVWADLVRDFTTRAGTKDICLVCLSPVGSPAVAHFNDKRGPSQRNCPVQLLLGTGEGAKPSERIESVISAKKQLLQPYSNLCQAFRLAAENDAERTGVINPFPSFLKYIIPTLDEKTLAGKVEQLWADRRAVDGPVSLIVLEGHVGCIVGYSIGNGKFEWLPFALPMDKGGRGTLSWADIVMKITQKCKGEPVLVSFWWYETYPNVAVRLKDIMPASNMEELGRRFSDLDHYTATCHLSPTFHFGNECLRIWRGLVEKLEQPQRERLHVLCQMGKVNVTASTIPDEDDTKNLKKELSRKKDSAAFDFMLRLMTQAQTLRDLFHSPPSMASVLQLKQDFDYDLSGVTGEFPKLCLGILHPFVVQSSTEFHLINQLGMVLGGNDALCDEDVEQILHLLSGVPLQQTLELLTPIIALRDIAIKNGQEQCQPLPVILLHLAYLNSTIDPAKDSGELRVDLAPMMNMDAKMQGHGHVSSIIDNAADM